MSRDMKIYIKYSELDERAEHFVKWFVGLLNMRGVSVKCVDSGCGEPIEFGVVKMEVESGLNIFDLTLVLGIDLARLMRSCPTKIRLGICKDDECVDVNMVDITRWYEEDILEIPGKKSRGVKIFVYRPCDVCEEFEATNVFLTWLSGFIRRSGYDFKLDDERGEDVWVYEVVDGVFKVPDVSNFIVEKGWYIAYAAYLIGAYVEVSVCDWDEEECTNLHLSDIRKMERDELPIVGV
jgi:hypothetical protein